jgi:hypothetical protein
MNRPDTIGVTVREITAEISMAKVSVQPNSCRMRPMMPPVNSSGMKAATSDRLMETIVKPICRAPASAACAGFRPSCMFR